MINVIELVQMNGYTYGYVAFDQNSREIVINRAYCPNDGLTADFSGLDIHGAIAKLRDIIKSLVRVEVQILPNQFYAIGGGTYHVMTGTVNN